MCIFVYLYLISYIKLITFFESNVYRIEYIYIVFLMTSSEKRNYITKLIRRKKCRYDKSKNITEYGNWIKGICLD